MSADDLAARWARALSARPPAASDPTSEPSGLAGAYTADDRLVTDGSGLTPSEAAARQMVLRRPVAALAPVPPPPVRPARPPAPAAIPREADRLERMSGPAALASADEWETAPRPVVEAYDAATAQAGYDLFVETLGRLLVDVDELSTRVLGLNARVEHEGQLEVAAYVADQLDELRADLARIAHGVVLAGSKALRRHPELSREGTLPDGRQYVLRRGKKRKAWKHEDWKRDLRVKLAEEAAADVPAEVVDPATGDVVDVRRIVAREVERAQAVHGATDPKVTELRRHGLDPADYAEEEPGLWAFDLSAPATPDRP